MLTQLYKTTKALFPYAFAKKNNNLYRSTANIVLSVTTAAINLAVPLTLMPVSEFV